MLIYIKNTELCLKRRSDILLVIPFHFARCSGVAAYVGATYLYLPRSVDHSQEDRKSVCLTGRALPASETYREE